MDRVPAPFDFPITWELPRQEDGFLSPLETAVLQAVSYADVFDFPLTAAEIRQNLVAVAAATAAVQAALAAGRLLPGYLGRQDGYYFLRGRESIVATRRLRSAAGAQLWPKARAYGRFLARAPFVRLVAVTGALAANNARPGDDIDYLIVSAPGRLWLCRAWIILLVRAAARRGDTICPNYFLTTQALALPEQDLFTAHELLQMRPLFGFDIYRRMLELNPWARGWLPSAFAARQAESYRPAPRPAGRHILEGLLRLPPGDWLERWEMERKIAKFGRQMAELEMVPADGPRSELIEVAFNAHCCKGHFNQHGRQTLSAYAAMLKNLERANPPESGLNALHVAARQPELTFHAEGD